MQLIAPSTPSEGPTSLPSKKAKVKKRRQRKATSEPDASPSPSLPLNLPLEHPLAITLPTPNPTQETSKGKGKLVELTTAIYDINSNGPQPISRTINEDSYPFEASASASPQRLLTPSPAPSSSSTFYSTTESPLHLLTLYSEHQEVRIAGSSVANTQEQEKLDCVTNAQKGPY